MIPLESRIRSTQTVKKKMTVSVIYKHLKQWENKIFIRFWKRNDLLWIWLHIVKIVKLSAQFWMHKFGLSLRLYAEFLLPSAVFTIDFFASGKMLSTKMKSVQWFCKRLHSTMTIRAYLHQASVWMQSQCCDDACDIVLIEKNGVTPKWVATHSGVTLFVSSDLSKSCITGVIIVLTLGWCRRLA